MKRTLGAFIFGLASLAFCNGTDEHTGSPAIPTARLLPPTTPEMLATVSVSLDSQRALGLESASVEWVSARKSSTVAGEVMVPPDRDIVLAAPTSGRVTRPGARLPQPGEHVAVGQVLLGLVPMATVDRNAKAAAARDVETGRANLELAEARATRAATMLLDRSGSQRGVEETHAQRQVALAELEAARARLRTLAGGALDADIALSIKSPVDGVVRALRVAPGQAVPTGTPLVDITGSGRWVRVSLAPGDAQATSSQAEASARRVGSVESVPITFVLAAPSADPTRASVDRFFALPGSSDWTPGERLLVELLTPAATRALAVPASAVVRDAEGAAWVYEQLGAESFRRRRVEPLRRAGSLLLLAHGPSPESRVVSTGAMELWGFELGADR